MSYKWLEWAQRIQALSQAGLAFSKDVFDLERFEELRTISAEIMKEHTDLEMEKIKDLFTNETGYQTPKFDVRGVVFKDNKLLMIKEKLDGHWAMPGGFCEIGLSPSENIVKEIREESGFEVVATKLLAVFDTLKHDHPPLPYQYYKLFFRCEIIGGKAEIGTETNDVDFFEETNLPPLSLARNTNAQIKRLFEFANNPEKETLFD